MPHKAILNSEDHKIKRKWALEDYRNKNRMKLNEKSRARTAKARAALKNQPPEVQEAKRLANRASSRNYCEWHQERVNLKAHKHHIE
ncbi:hypothetical protein DXG01_003237 [Tephrocybe rancida]|nr:hypothetical protein DXG01_003237 [Tephrocybe rancida]